MAEYMKKLVYLTEEQKNTLFANGSITVGGKTITYDPNDVYVTPKDLPEFHIGTVQTLPVGESASASITGTTEDPVLNLGLPTGATGDRGPKGDTGDTGLTPDLQIGTVSTLPAGSSATATITGTDEQPILNLGIPQGIKGDTGNRGETGLTPDLSVGTVSTLPAGSSATVTITGTDEDPVLNFGIPQGVKGDTGNTGLTPELSAGTVQTLPAGSSATVTITGTDEQPVLNFGIPQGIKGDQGDDYVLTAQDKTDIAAEVEGMFYVNMSGSDLNITADRDTRYLCGTLNTLTFTPSAEGISNVRFTSGTTATVLTLPNTVKMPDWWEGVEANYTYEISIADGVYGAVMAWQA